MEETKLEFWGEKMQGHVLCSQVSLARPPSLNTL